MLLRAEDQARFQGRIDDKGATVWASYRIEGRVEVLVNTAPGFEYGATSGVWATLIHTLGYFTVTAAAALLVYQRFGLAMLRRSWFNLDLMGLSPW